MNRFYFLLSIVFISLFPFLGLGQSGPAGVGTGDGSSGPQNVLWLRSDIGISESGGKVSAWTDQSGNNLDASQSTPGLQADYTASNANLNGFPSINFGSSGGYLTIGDDDLLDDTDGLTAFFVLRTPSSIGTEAILSKRVANNNEQSYVFFTTGGGFEARFDGDNGVDSENSTISTSENVLLSSVFNGSVQSISNFLNTADAGTQTGASNVLLNRVSDLFIGTFEPGDTRYFNGDVAEIILYRDALNGAERLIVENYLAEKYDLTITNDIFGEYVDFDSDYFNDFRAIGTSNGTDKKSESGFSDAFQIREANGGLDTNLEFFALGHNDAVAHSDGVIADLGANITSRWGKDFYLENSQNNVIDNGESDMDIIFDFGTAGFTLGSPSNYVLLYRSANSGNYERVFANSYGVENGDQLVVNVPGNRIKSGFYTVGLGDQLISRTWYVLKNGDWTDPNTWTLDAGIAPAPNNPGGDTPGVEDNVVIRNGRTVNIQTGTNDLEIASLRVDGTINLNNTTGHNFNVINGKGTINIQGNAGISNFPQGNTTGSNGFANELNGGLLVVSGSGLEFDQDLTLRNLRIDITNPTDLAILGADLTLNGDFTIRKGTWQFGDNTTAAREFTIFGDVLIQNNGTTQDGRISTSTQDARHSFNLYGDFINDGNARFSQRTTQTVGSDPNNGITDFYLLSTDRNQTIRANGPTYFLRVIIDKGDPAYSATFTASQPTNFVLTGRANQNIGGDVTVPNDNQNAFGLITGTAILGTNINVDPLNNTGNYSIGTNAKLLIDGGFARKTGGNAITPYGEIEVNAGTLQVESNSGITSRDAGILKVNGGVVNIPQFRTSNQGVTNVGGLEINGGQVNIENTGGQSASGAYYSLSLTYSENAFIMTGGTLNVSDATGRGLIFINSDPGNINVTGGQVNLFRSNNNLAKISSNAPFFNLNLDNTNNSTNANAKFAVVTGTSGNGAEARTITDPELKVLNNFILETGTTRSASGNTYGSYIDFCNGGNCNALFVGGDLRIEDSAVLDIWSGNADNAGSSTVTFNTDKNALLYVGDITTYDAAFVGYTDPEGATAFADWEQPFYNMIIDKGGSTLQMAAKDPGDTGSTGDVKTGSGGKNVFNWRTNLFKVTNQFQVLDNSFLDQRDESVAGVAYSIRLYGSEITNNGTVFYYEDGTTPVESLVKFRQGGGDITINSIQGSEFGNVRLNSAGDVINLTSDLYIKRIEYRHGRMNIFNHNLKVDRFVYNLAGGEVNGNDFGVEDMIIMDGNASDGGLSILISGLNNPGNPGHGSSDSEASFPASHGNTRVYLFPIGVGSTGTYPASRYNPANIRFDQFFDDGYVTVNIVADQLQTAGPHPLNNDVLNKYWRVRYEGFTDLPIVDRHRFEATEADFPNGYTGDEQTVWEPSFVLDENPYTRTAETGGSSQLTDPDNPQVRLLFFGDTGSGATPFELINANYTAGDPSKFTGAPTVYYTRRPGDGFTRKWNNGVNWTLAPNDIDGNSTIDKDELHDSRQPAAGAFPQAGDIAVIGWVPFGDPGGTDGDPHGIAIDGITANFAEIRFTKMTDVSGNPVERQYAFNFQFRPTVVINSNNSFLNGSSISGEGLFWLRSQGAGQSDPDFSGIDIGGFISEDSSYLVYENTQNGFVFDNVPAIVPNLLLAGNGWGAQDRDFRISTNVNVKGNLELLGDVNLRLSSGATGDFLVENNLRIFRSTANGNDSGGNGRIDFPNDASRTIEVLGDLRLENQNALIRVLNPNTTINESNLIVHGDIIQDNIAGGGLQLYSNSNEDFVKLVLKGEGNNSFDYRAGAIPNLHSVEINKGAGQTSSFTFESDITIPLPADIAQQPIEIVNGLLVIDHPNIDLTLTDAARGNFNLPNLSNLEASSGSGGLELRQGVLRIEGDNTGLVLDGLLSVSGGTLDMASGAGNGNNFIEYSVSGNAEIDITDGVLDVGSQVRRGLLSSSGVLKYNQSGGTARFGINTAPEQNRAVFEVLNTGSEFNHLGGDFIVERQNGSTTTASLRLQPDSYDFTGSTITIGGVATPAGQNQFGINATVPINTLLITGNNNLNARTFINPLTVNNLEVENNGRFSANGLDLTIIQDLTVNGTLNNQGDGINQQTTFFNTTTSQNISGNGSISFWNVDKNGTGTLSLNHDITIENNLNILNGVLNTTSSTLNLEGDLIHDGEHQSAVAGPGIVFNGTATQNIARTTNGQSTFGTITINNSNGVEVTAGQNDFEINHKVILASGVFDIGSNLLIMDEDAVFENGSGGTSVSDFNVNNMITVNTSLIDKGVRKIYPNNFSGNFLYPVGLLNYTPAVIGASDIDGNGFITIKPIDNFSDGITDDFDEDCAGAADYDDTENVLQYYWLVKSQGITNFDGSFTMYHNDALEAVNNAEGLDLTNYAPARLLNVDDTWDKIYSEQLFDEVANTITFQSDISNEYSGLNSASIEGRYTAGITRDAGDALLCGSAIPNVVPLFETLIGASDGNVNVGGSFAGGVAPSVGQSPDLVVRGDYTLVLNDNFRRFRKVTIEENATLEINSTFGHNLGTIEGNGTLKLVDDASFPAGDYEDFFPDSNCSDGGGLEYENNDIGSDVTVLAEGFTNLKELILSGNGKKIMSNGVSVNICENLEMTGGDFEMSNNSELRVKGNIIKNGGSNFNAEFTNAKVVMDGISNQTIEGQFTGLEAFNVLEVNKSSGSMSVINAGNDDVEVSGNLIFTNGLINTDEDNSLIIQTNATLTGFKTSSHVNGPLVRNLNASTASQFDKFPVGQGGRYGLIEISDIDVTDNWTAIFYDESPDTNSQIPNLNSDLAGPDPKVSGNQYWELTSDLTNFANVKIYWDSNSDIADGAASVGQSISELRVVRFKPGTSSVWEDQGNSSVSGNASGGELTSSNRLDFSTNFVTFGAGDASNNSLPVEMVFFTAESRSNRVELSWQTASEINNDFFEVQRSFDGKEFEVIGSVEGNGNSLASIDYSFNDYSPLAGDSYYRLRQVDYDGAFEYSEVVRITREEASDLVAVPNPTQAQNIHLRLSGFHAEQKIQVTIFDVQGRRHYQGILNPSDLNKPLPINQNLNSGIYIVNVKQGNINKKVRLMVR
ncbi:hypothetical protein MATR_10240 [Marivirga tractuosa]|uniref:Secretion system C-terminal sorting domain-containing protein n=1 Tax=Marivirga tractuosa (strain ATCC 23168 / DSM 4126 / NBRC 15989 / NCIMB 1408 / VKM B-1430 / H-43) TaxID=643867 RepID=E4TM71_MARTH|nr:T9SS type A sorting domain-containing protein [Marivirga tractuosa]ADR21347.1 hypothetical protein Ftrac_1357 [Marivirga tractuosa DSM 4126]BDD14199.1 hypothetical protein MATR_10240 [Marivirga tractuosa]